MASDWKFSEKVVLKYFCSTFSKHGTSVLCEVKWNCRIHIFYCSQFLYVSRANIRSPLQVNPISTMKTYSLVHSKLNNLAQNSTDNMYGIQHTVWYLPDPIQIYWHAMNERCLCAICYNPQHLCAMFDKALETWSIYVH